MEFILVILVIVVLCVILGVSTGIMLAGALIFVGLVIAFIALFFTASLIIMLTAKKMPARFSRIDKRPNGRFSVAHYIIDGDEYPNIFPDEGIFRNRLYKTDKIYNVRIDKSRRFVFDRFACATTVIGFIAGILMAAAAAVIAVSAWEV